MWRTPQAGTTARVRRAIAATRAISPRAGRAAGSGVMAALPVVENLLDRPLEQPGEAEGERQRRIVFAGLDRVDRLARHAEPAAKLRLAPVPLGPQHFETVLHCFPDVHRGVLPRCPARIAGHGNGPRRRFAVCQAYLTLCIVSVTK